MSRTLYLKCSVLMKYFPFRQFRTLLVSLTADLWLTAYILLHQIITCMLPPPITSKVVYTDITVLVEQ